MDLSFRDLPVSTFNDLKKALFIFFESHWLLRSLVSHPDGIQEMVDLWPYLEDKPGKGEPDFTLGDSSDMVEDIVGELVSFNNNPWNFDPKYTPPKRNHRQVIMLVRCLLGSRQLLRVDVNNNAPVGAPQILVMYQGRKKVFIETWSWSDPTYYTHEVVRLSSHLSMHRATKRFEKEIANWQLVEE